MPRKRPDPEPEDDGERDDGPQTPGEKAARTRRLAMAMCRLMVAENFTRYESAELVVHLDGSPPARIALLPAVDAAGETE